MKQKEIREELSNETFLCRINNEIPLNSILFFFCTVKSDE